MMDLPPLIMRGFEAAAASGVDVVKAMLPLVAYTAGGPVSTSTCCSSHAMTPLLLMPPEKSMAVVVLYDLALCHLSVWILLISSSVGDLLMVVVEFAVTLGGDKLDTNRRL